MEHGSLVRHARALARVAFWDWAWWRLPWLLRIYVGAVPIAAVAAPCFAASQTSWHAADLVKFVLLLGCGLVSVAATPRIAYSQGALVRDFVTVWVLPIAILLPPVLRHGDADPAYVLTQWRVYRGVVYRRVFTVAAMGLCYGAASSFSVPFPRPSPAVRSAPGCTP